MSFPKKTDAQIQAAVLGELKWDARVKETDIGVEVHQGTVTLTGTVGTWPERLAANEAAHRVSGVLDVADDVRVKPHDEHERTDTEIAQAVRQALVSDVSIPHERIQSTVSNGEVVLDGHVALFSQSDDAARDVRNVQGVKHVRNHIVVTPEPKGSALAIRLSIEGALANHAARSASHVVIEVDDGKVILSGSVPSQAELDAVVTAARATSGVHEVDNRIDVES